MKTLSIMLILVGLFFGNTNVDGASKPLNPSQDKEPYLYMESYTEDDGGSSSATLSVESGYWYETFNYQAQNNRTWANDSGGNGSLWWNVQYTDFDDGWENVWETDDLTSPASHWPTVAWGTNYTTSFYESEGGGYPYSSSTNYGTNDWNPLRVQEHCSVRLPVGIDAGWPYSWEGSYFPAIPENTGLYHRSADAVMKLQTGGKAQSHRQNLFCISASATNILDQYSQSQMSGDDVTWSGTGETANIPPTSITINGRVLDADGKLWVALQDNRPIDVTPIVKTSDFYTFNVDQQKYTLVHETVHPALTDTNLDRLNLGVGEEVNFGFNPTLPINGTWLVTAGGLNTNVAPNVLFTAPSNAPSGSGLVVVRVAVPNGEHVYELFKVFEPSGIATNTYKVYDYTNAPWLFWGQGHSGAGMYIRVYVAPTDVSFYKAHCMEVGEDATGVWGYYTNNPPWTTNILSHKGSTGAGKGDDPFGINPDNSWQNNGTGTYDWDRCTMGNPDPISPNPQWSSGGYTWNIPGAWTVDGNTWHTNMGSWSQTFTMQGDGTVTIQKFNQTVTRNPSSP